MKAPLRHRLPLGASLNVAGAVEGLRLADEALIVAVETLDSNEPAMLHGLDHYNAAGFQAAVRLFLELLAPAADTVRAPICMFAMRRTVREHAEDPRNVPGLERAAIALGFATAYLDDGIDELADAEGDAADEWHGKCLAATHGLDLIRAAIESSVVGGWRNRPGADDSLN
jgi:hypothetical protein